MAKIDIAVLSDRSRFELSSDESLLPKYANIHDIYKNIALYTRMFKCAEYIQDDNYLCVE